MAFQIEHLRFKDFTKCVAYTRDKIRIKFQLLQKCFVPDLHKYLWPWHDLQTASSHGNLYNSFVVLRTSTIVLWVSFFTNEIRTQMEKTKTWLWNDPSYYHWDITQWIMTHRITTGTSPNESWPIVLPLGHHPMNHDPSYHHWDITQWISQSVCRPAWLTDRQTDRRNDMRYS